VATSKLQEKTTWICKTEQQNSFR